MTNTNFMPAACLKTALTGKLRQLAPVLTATLFLGLASASAQADADVTLTPLFFFSQTNGVSPNAFLRGLDGNFYGNTLSGGSNGNYGTVFQYTTNGYFRSVYAFSAANGRTNSAIQPLGLLQKADGTFFGTSFAGGVYNYGMLYQLNTNGSLQVVYSFDNTNGAFPKSGVILNTNDGTYYGTTFSGGTNGSDGTVYKVTTNGTYTSLFSFSGVNGDGPYASPTLGLDGNLYGTAYFGGTNINNAGTLFRISTNGTFTNLFSFDGTTYGASPLAGLLLASDGYLYGTTSQGGQYGYGTIFRVNTNGNLSTLFSFGNTNGATPLSSMIQGRDGALYGQTEYGGTNGNYGTIFSFSTNGLFTSLFSFGGTNGAQPTSPLVQVSRTTFYGVTSSGGANNGGTIFQFTIIPPSPLLTLSVNGSSLNFSWNSLSGMTYQLQSNPDLNPFNWTNNGPVITANGTNTILTHTASSSQFYYRLLVAPQ